MKNGHSRRMKQGRLLRAIRKRGGLPARDVFDFLHPGQSGRPATGHHPSLAIVGL